MRWCGVGGDAGPVPPASVAPPVVRRQVWGCGATRTAKHCPMAGWWTWGGVGSSRSPLRRGAQRACRGRRLAEGRRPRQCLRPVGGQGTALVVVGARDGWWLVLLEGRAVVGHERACVRCDLDLVFERHYSGVLGRTGAYSCATPRAVLGWLGRAVRRAKVLRLPPAHAEGAGHASRLSLQEQVHGVLPPAAGHVAPTHTLFPFPFSALLRSTLSRAAQVGGETLHDRAQ